MTENNQMNNMSIREIIEQDPDIKLSKVEEDKFVVEVMNTIPKEVYEEIMNRNLIVDKKSPNTFEIQRPEER